MTMSSATTYDADILEWSEEQASALRNLARSRPDLSNELDWENIAEEIECVGRSEFAAVQSFVRQVFIHLIKAVSVPDASSTRHWRSEVSAFHANLLDRITPSMPGRINAAKLWQQALKQAELDLAVHGQSVTPALPHQCPLAIQDIVNPDFNFEKAVEAVRKQINDGHASV
jgi:Domain of unknown function DUF29